MSEKVPKFEGCKLSFDLVAQSPQIHFQWNELGATLRGSELKPKLDKFLKKKMGQKNDDALNYKVKIVCKEAPAEVELGIFPKKDSEGSYAIFYGNTGRKDGKLKGIWSNPTITFICFDEQIKKALEENIVEFFYVTNFGMMQDKGFGSYIIKGTEQLAENTICNWIMNEHNAEKCWSCSLKNNGKARDLFINDPDKRCNMQMDLIKSFYGIMKSGQNFGGYVRSFLYEYMHKSDKISANTSNVKVNIDNEKAWMKQNRIAPTYQSKTENVGNHDSKAENARYVRAFLGLTGPQSWISGTRQEKGKEIKTKVTISVNDPNKKIERFASPVNFKIVGNDIYIVADQIPDEMYDQEFTFMGMNKKMNLRTPSKSDFTDGIFNIEEFISNYVDYYNKRLNVPSKTKMDREFSKIKEEWRRGNIE